MSNSAPKPENMLLNLVCNIAVPCVGIAMPLEVESPATEIDGNTDGPRLPSD